MRLTLYTDYSLRVLLYLSHKQDATVTISELADYYHISRNHLVKVVHNLGLKGYILTTRGKNGGIRLARPASEIVVGAVVRDMEPDLDLLECFNPATDQCVITNICSLKHAFFDANKAFLDELDRHTLADTAKGKAKSTGNFKSIPLVAAAHRPT